MLGTCFHTYYLFKTEVVVSVAICVIRTFEALFVGEIHKIRPP